MFLHVNNGERLAMTERGNTILEHEHSMRYDEMLKSLEVYLDHPYSSLANGPSTARNTLPYYCHMGRVLILSFIGIMFLLFSHEPGAGG